MAAIRGTTHPLQTPLILECIFKNLSVPDLKAFRQVNSLWHEIATKRMRSAVQVKFQSTKDAKAKEKMLEFLELVQSELSTFSTLPFANDYKLTNIMDFPEFWAFCGSSVKSLYLSRMTLHSGDIFRHVILQSCPNLEYLTLFDVQIAGPDGEDVERVWVPPQFPQNPNLKRIEFKAESELGYISLVELFSHFPALEELHMDPFDSELTNRIFLALGTCREHDPRSWNIKNISFNFLNLRRKPQESYFRFLLDHSPTLESLVVYCVKSPEQVNTFRNILRANAATLKSLKIVGISPVDIFETPFHTILEKVADFSLEEAHITSLNFLRRFPNLKKLELSNCFYSLETELVEEPLNEWIVSSCTELTVDFEQSCGEKLFPLFRRIPNVEKLGVRRCRNELFAGICDIFQNLVCLELEESMVNDYGISGLDEEDVERINEDGNLVRRSVTVPRPNLSSLKNLKWFRYETYRPRENDLIRFCAALCGVQQLPQLQHLKVEGSTRPIWDRLCDQFPWRDP